MKAFSTGVASVVLALVGATSHIDAVAQEAYFMHPSSCVAPFLFQAERMRWHEHFLMNPPEGQRTWAVCPIDMYVSDLADAGSPRNYLIQVYLQNTLDAVMVNPVCFFTGHSVLNQQWGNYIDGDDLTYTLPLTLQQSGGITVAQGVASVADILAGLPPGTAESPFHLAAYCRLYPGWGINGVEFIELVAPTMGSGAGLLY
jgi:hypothetical protein